MTTTFSPVITGQSLIAGRAVEGTAGTAQALNPATNEKLEPAITLIDDRQLAEATAAAAAAFDTYRATTPAERAAFLERIADNIDALGAPLTERAVLETGLPAARIDGERARTVGQLRLFAGVVRQGDHLQARIDPALPDRAPLPRLDIRQRHIGLGPVAVFGASNFPLAFSTGGGDTASALAAGCPVIVKAHNAHPGTAELVGHAIVRAVEEFGLPAGVFSLIFGAGTSIGQALVADPNIKAVGFTGSRGGGTAIMATAAARPEPIPVYAEMSSINPVFVFPGAIEDDIGALATGLVGSLTMGAGQFCTNPGLVFVPSGTQGDGFVAAASEALRVTQGSTMLTRGIAAACGEGVAKLRNEADVTVVAEGQPGPTENAPGAVLFSTTTDSFRENLQLQEEVFGAAGIFVRYNSQDELLASAEALEGQLTATIHATASDNATIAPLLPVLERRVGRILFNSWPTGVEVGPAMVHGGPFPATSDSRSTSVGSLAIMRFQRPVSYQNIPDELLPAALQEANPWHLNRRINGQQTAS
ncbi:2,5-dioxovalerate dehydrogenase [Arthrobacter sp. RIT-PI-e]|uniref:aldehyde dehydrogenase (NADP(+)) n=1 Tax=Arthrobacter sp. RIT-PI-e TaxID=1681197 RepID=UPI000676399E|nr:aldehyde dehydrogenase (NADP(+)) [Arthrobacter sp. RIT-PI-e]KNC19888.1 2,5-dioxovalerate dehydrogenase [Arthrobacter sp. RIT-PI-e]